MVSTWDYKIIQSAGRIMNFNVIESLLVKLQNPNCNLLLKKNDHLSFSRTNSHNYLKKLLKHLFSYPCICVRPDYIQILQPKLYTATDCRSSYENLSCIMIYRHIKQCHSFHDFFENTVIFHNSMLFKLKYKEFIVALQ